MQSAYQCAIAADRIVSGDREGFLLSSFCWVIQKVLRMTSFSSQSPETISPARLLADQAFSRTAGAPLIAGNSIRLLKDATENYPAWLEAIESAKRTIHF